MNRTERLGAILDILAADGQVEVEEIVDKLGVSPATAGARRYRHRQRRQ